MVRITTCPFLWGPLALYTSSPLILAIHLLIMQVATWMPIPSAAFLSLLWVATDRVMLLRVISSLMRLDCQLRVFNAEVTAFPRIAPPPRPHSWPTMLVLLFRTSGRAVFGGCAAFSFRDLGWPRTRSSSAMSSSSLDLPYLYSDVSSSLTWALGSIWDRSGLLSPSAPHLFKWSCNLFK